MSYVCHVPEIWGLMRSAERCVQNAQRDAEKWGKWKEKRGLQRWCEVRNRGGEVSREMSLPASSRENAYVAEGLLKGWWGLLEGENEAFLLISFRGFTGQLAGRKSVPPSEKEKIIFFFFFFLGKQTRGNASRDERERGKQNEEAGERECPEPIFTERLHKWERENEVKWELERERERERERRKCTCS